MFGITDQRGGGLGVLLPIGNIYIYIYLVRKLEIDRNCVPLEININRNRLRNKANKEEKCAR